MPSHPTPKSSKTKTPGKAKLSAKMLRGKNIEKLKLKKQKIMRMPIMQIPSKMDQSPSAVSSRSERHIHLDESAYTMPSAKTQPSNVSLHSERPESITCFQRISSWLRKKTGRRSTATSVRSLQSQRSYYSFYSRSSLYRRTYKWKQFVYAVLVLIAIIMVVVVLLLASLGIFG